MVVEYIGVIQNGLKIEYLVSITFLSVKEERTVALIRRYKPRGT